MSGAPDGLGEALDEAYEKIRALEAELAFMKREEQRLRIEVVENLDAHNRQKARAEAAEAKLAEAEKPFALVDIGCIECGEPSEYLGEFETEETAERFWKEYAPEGHGWGRPEWSGQHGHLVARRVREAKP